MVIMRQSLLCMSLYRHQADACAYIQVNKINYGVENLATYTGSK